MKHAFAQCLIVSSPYRAATNWLLSGVVVVEVFFEYDGFGKMLAEASPFPDIEVCRPVRLVACSGSRPFPDYLSRTFGYTFPLIPAFRFSS